MTRRLLALSAFFAVAGCGSALDPVLASKPEYELYRSSRIASSLEARLAASARYLETHPNGRFRGEVERWFTRTESAYWQRSRNDLARLHAYLDTLPSGPHAKLAAERIVELELAEKHVRGREERLSEEARAVEEKLSDAASMRRNVVDTLSSFSRLLAGISSFGRPTSELDHELIFAWRISEPASRCIGDRCVKALALPYAIPDSGRLAPRKALIDVVIDLDRGNVKKAFIAGPELFSRVGEALELRPVRPSDQQARAEAIARALGVVELAIEPVLPARRCRREAVSPVVLARSCDGVALRMIAAPTPDSDDRVEVEAARDEPEPSP